MALSKRKREELLALCGEIHEDDAVDPHTFFNDSHNSNKRNRKTLQLCRQVGEVLGLVLADGHADSALADLYVESIEPAPDASRMLVTVRADVPMEHFDPASILELLASQAARLRCEVAASITRKRAPQLMFTVLGPEQHGGLDQ